MTGGGIDETLSNSETLRFLNKWRLKIAELKKTTHFTKDELERLFLIHYKITSACGPINLGLFQEFCHTVLGITDDSHIEKMYLVFDPDLKSFVSPMSFASNLSVILRGTLSEQCDFVWKVYSHDGFITRDVITSCLKKVIIQRKFDTGYDSMVKDLVSMVLKRLDRAMVGKVSEDEFRRRMQENPLLLECLGPCLPAPRAATAFLATFSAKPIRIRVLPLPDGKWKPVPFHRRIAFKYGSTATDGTAT